MSVRVPAKLAGEVKTFLRKAPRKLPLITVGSGPPLRDVP